MPNGWKKNAKYFNHLEMSHSEYVKKKNKFRKWKKKQEKTNKYRFVDSKRIYGEFYLDEYGPCNCYSERLTQKDKGSIEFYMSKQNVKQSNATFRKGVTITRAWNKPLFKTKKNCNKYTRFTKKSHKVYFNDHKKKQVRPLCEKQITKEELKHECSICCEQEVVSKLFTVCCRRKGIGSFNKNSDKVICNDCRSKVDTCPYCRSHTLKCVKYKSSREKSITLCAAQQWERKKQSRELLDNVAEFEWRKRARKKMYPNKMLWLCNGEVNTEDKTPYGYQRALPLKLYKYYLDRDIEYTHFKNIDEQVYRCYDEIPEREYYIGSIKV